MYFQVKHITVHVDNDLVSPCGGFLLRKGINFIVVFILILVHNCDTGPGNNHYDYGQLVNFIQEHNEEFVHAPSTHPSGCIHNHTTILYL